MRRRVCALFAVRGLAGVELARDLQTASAALFVAPDLFPDPLQAGDLRLVEFPQRSDDPLPRSPRRAHRLAEMPITVPDAPGLFIFSPQKHAGSIRQITATDKRVFGTTSPARDSLL